MPGDHTNTATQSTLEPQPQDIRSRDVSRASQVGAKLSRVRRSPSPTPFQGLLSQKPSLAHVTRLSPPVGQFVINTLLQIAGFIAAIAFGIYAVQSVTVGKDANQYSNIANQLALLGLCLQTNNQVSSGQAMLVSTSVSRKGQDSLRPLEQRCRFYLFTHHLLRGYCVT